MLEEKHIIQPKQSLPLLRVAKLSLLGYTWLPLSYPESSLPKSNYHEHFSDRGFNNRNLALLFFFLRPLESQCFDNPTLSLSTNFCLTLANLTKLDWWDTSFIIGICKLATGFSWYLCACHRRRKSSSPRRCLLRYVKLAQAITSLNVVAPADRRVSIVTQVTP